MLVLEMNGSHDGSWDSLGDLETLIGGHKIPSKVQNFSQLHI